MVSVHELHTVLPNLNMKSEYRNAQNDCSLNNIVSTNNYIHDQTVFLVSIKKEKKEEILQTSALESTGLCYVSLWPHCLEVTGMGQGNFIYW